MKSPKINELQLLQQNLQNLVSQKQQLQSQMVEIDSALSELQTTNKAYRILGKIMLAIPKEDLIKELREKKDVAEIRLKNVGRQEEKIKENLETVQKEVIKELREKK